MPALSRARDQARRVGCGNNLKQIGTSLHMYANDYDGKLPLNANAGNWWWDIAYSTTDYIIKTGGDRRTFYCPCDKSKNGDMAIVWQYSTNPPIGASPDQVCGAQDNRDSLYRVTSYFWIMDTKPGSRQDGQAAGRARQLEMAQDDHSQESLGHRTRSRCDAQHDEPIPTPHPSSKCGVDCTANGRSSTARITSPAAAGPMAPTSCSWMDTWRNVPSATCSSAGPQCRSIGGDRRRAASRPARVSRTVFIGQRIVVPFDWRQNTPAR